SVRRSWAATPTIHRSKPPALRGPDRLPAEVRSPTRSLLRSSKPRHIGRRYPTFFRSGTVLTRRVVGCGRGTGRTGSNQLPDLRDAPAAGPGRRAKYGYAFVMSSCARRGGMFSGDSASDADVPGGRRTIGRGVRQHGWTGGARELRWHGIPSRHGSGADGDPAASGGSRRRGTGVPPVPGVPGPDPVADRGRAERGTVQRRPG